MALANKYVMTISRLTVDKLGVKLYDRVSAVIAEIVANSYDADATQVSVSAPMGQWLASKGAGTITDKGYTIDVTDNGHGMLPNDINTHYLKVGAERRSDPKRGDKSKKYKRRVMGRKGVGKLAPFGVCRYVEVISSGGEAVAGIDEAGHSVKGYLTAHFILDRDEILSDTDAPYTPTVGKLDGKVRPAPGTTIRMRQFGYRRVPTIEDFERQLSQRFGVRSPNWTINLLDALKTSADQDATRAVGEFSVKIMSATKIMFITEGENTYRAIGPANEDIPDLKAGFDHDGEFYPITGWVGYSETPYKDELMAGVRIYCRGKIAAQTNIFNMRAGFTGEYDVRSYLVGELNADWLDRDEDLIRTDRQDILWSHELGQRLEEWGQALVKKVGAITREPKRKKAWERFKEVSKIETRVEKAFPSQGQQPIRDATLELAKHIARTTSAESLEDEVHVESIVSLCLMLGPHVTLDQKLREAADETNDELSVITAILKTARLAELSAFGRIAEDRVKVIKRVELLKDDADTLEAAFQELIGDAPWLIDPQWSPVVANQSFSTLRDEFQKFYKKRTGNDLTLQPFAKPLKRADFVLANNERGLELVEIKKPVHALTNEEMDRINTYVELLEAFLDMAGHEEFKAAFPEFHVTLVTDSISLTGVHLKAFDAMKKEKRLTHLTWVAFLRRTRRTHEDFLEEAEKQRKNAAQSF